MSNSTFDVFISYSHRDIEWVRDWLLPRLEAAGLRVCIDFRDFKIGVPSLDNMADAAMHSRKTLFVMTPNWTVSEFSQFEALVTQTIDPIGKGGRLLPLMLKDCDLSMRLRILTYADFRDADSWETEFARLVKTIKPELLPEQARVESNAPTQNLVHPYPIQANFTGRERECKELNEWLADDARPLCALVAMGGMGKSALAWVWVKTDVLGDARPDTAPIVDGVMWWSFYEGESSFARFIDEALRYVGGRAIDASVFPTTYDRAQELRQLLQSKRILFVLDGFERQLRVYASLDAAYKQDAAAEESRDARSCVDPEAMRFLKAIVAGTTRAKLLLTTRLMPSDLEDRAGDSLAGALKRELKQLPPDDALPFMRAQGVTKGTDAEIAVACAAYGYHPLSLRLLSGLIARDTRIPGDINAAPRHDVHADLIQRQHHVLEQSYNALSTREQALLSRIAAFRNPMTYDALHVFNEFGDEAKFEAALEELRERGLLQRDITHNRYDLHPIVRHYSYDRLTDKLGVHTKLRDYFATVPVLEEAKTEEELYPVIELFHHCVRAGYCAEALSVFEARLNRPLYLVGGRYDLCIELVSGLLSTCGTSAFGGISYARSTLLNKLGLCYNRVGKSLDAESAFREQIRIREKMGSLTGAAVGLGNLSEVLVRMGRLKEATEILQRKIDISEQAGDKFKEMAGRQDYGLSLAYRGEFEEAANQLKDTITWLSLQKEARYEGVSWAFDTLTKVLQGHFKEALKSAKHARRLASNEGRQRDLVRAEWLLGLAYILAAESSQEAASSLDAALATCRRINLVEMEPDILLAWARWHRARGNAEEAQTQAEEALAIADRCEYRLKQAEIRNFLARVALEAGERETAREHAEIAKERAWCDGPPYCYRVALDEAEAFLMELGAEEEK